MLATLLAVVVGACSADLSDDAAERLVAEHLRQITPKLWEQRPHGPDLKILSISPEDERVRKIRFSIAIGSGPEREPDWTEVLQIFIERTDRSWEVLRYGPRLAPYMAGEVTREWDIHYGPLSMAITTLQVAEGGWHETLNLRSPRDLRRFREGPPGDTLSRYLAADSSRSIPDSIEWGVTEPGGLEGPRVLWARYSGDTTVVCARRWGFKEGGLLPMSFMWIEDAMGEVCRGRSPHVYDPSRADDRAQQLILEKGMVLVETPVR